MLLIAFISVLLCSAVLLLCTMTNDPFVILPHHLLVDILIRVPILEWGQISCVSSQWASLSSTRILLAFCPPSYISLCSPPPLIKTCPGPIPQPLFSKRRYAALYVSKHIFSMEGGEFDEIVGYTYLFLKDQLQISSMPLSSGIIHGTIIDQFIACGASRDWAHEIASKIWLAAIDNLEENEQTFLLLKCLAMEGDVFLPYPYSRSSKVLWKVFEKLFTDFRDCFNSVDYYDILGLAKHKFQPIPSTWLGY